MKLFVCIILQDFSNQTWFDLSSQYSLKFSAKAWFLLMLTRRQSNNHTSNINLVYFLKSKKKKLEAHLSTSHLSKGRKHNTERKNEKKRSENLLTFTKEICQVNMTKLVRTATFNDLNKFLTIYKRNTNTNQCFNKIYNFTSSVHWQLIAIYCNSLWTITSNYF